MVGISGIRDGSVNLEEFVSSMYLLPFLIIVDLPLYCLMFPVTTCFEGPLFIPSWCALRKIIKFICSNSCVTEQPHRLLLQELWLLNNGQCLFEALP